MPAAEYPVDEWRIIERGAGDALVPRMETVFALSNGYLGIRGTPDEMAPVHEPGTFINGFYESWPIEYPESAYGFASAGQTIVNAPDATAIRLVVDNQTLTAATNPVSVERVLDMRSGILSREVSWAIEGGRVVRLRSQRLVSLVHRHLAAVSWEVRVEGGDAHVVVSSELFNQQDAAGTGHEEPQDPRRSRAFDQRVLLPRLQIDSEARIILGYRTQDSGLGLACGMDHIVETNDPVAVTVAAHPDSGVVSFSFNAEPQRPFRLAKLLAYHTDSPSSVADLGDRVARTLDEARKLGFTALAAEQKEALGAAWDRSDVRLRGRPRLQQAVRWNLFQLIQATYCVKRSGVAAKGLTSSGYDGHYFWDMDMFLMPFVVHTRPDLARELLLYRFDTLDAARDRAAEMSESGALFPWRTINGYEASAFFPAGTAQYHINAAIAHAAMKYDQLTGDDQFLLDAGAELVMDTARMWYSLGFFDSEGAFHLNGVTGPDEYTALVNDNTYTNLMAQLHLHYAADIFDRLAAEHPDRHVALVDALDISNPEVEGWRRAADHMTVLYDERRGIHQQDAEFLDLEVWDFAGTLPESYPLLLNHHPLVLYRHQVLKQSDVVLAMVLRGDLFTAEQKARNFAYYEPLTTDDSSLSTPIQAIVAAEVGATEVAARCFEQALFADLADVYGNVADGVHLASCGATWMTLVMGFGGMREFGERLAFDPRLPPDWESLEFSLTMNGRLLDVAVRPDEIEFSLRAGPGVDLEVRGVAMQVEPGEPTTVPL